MNTFKNLLIAVLTGLLALSLFTQPAHSAPKTYDAVKLAQYTECLRALNKDIVIVSQMAFVVNKCALYLP
jgi:hypothetical protein